MTEQVFVIENVGGIGKVSLTLRHGVCVLSGRNAAGKTSAFKAIARAQGGDVEIERRDGSERGIVTGPGVRLVLGRVAKRTGETEIELADISPLSQLIDPGLKDTDAAARSRVRALVEMLALRVDDEAIATLCGGNADLSKWLVAEVQSESIEDLLVAAEKLRMHAHALARFEEQRAAECSGRAAACADRARELREALGGTMPRESIAEANAALVDGSRQYERAVAQVDAREKLEAQQAEIRTTLGERPDPEAEAEGVRICEDEVERAAAEVMRLTALLAGARAAHSAATKALEAQRKAAAEAERAAQAWDRAQEILARTPEGPTRDELAPLKVRLVDQAGQRLQLARTAEEYHAAETERSAQDATRAAAAREAERLRQAALAIQGRLGELLTRAGAPGLTVIGGRLHAIKDGQPVDFERRLSEGQRVRAALDVAAHAYAGRVVPLSGHFWMALDPEAKREFARLVLRCEAHGLWDRDHALAMALWRDDAPDDRERWGWHADEARRSHARIIRLDVELERELRAGRGPHSRLRYVAGLALAGRAGSSAESRG